MQLIDVIDQFHSGTTTAQIGFGDDREGQVCFCHSCCGGADLFFNSGGSPVQNNIGLNPALCFSPGEAQYFMLGFSNHPTEADGWICNKWQPEVFVL
ncbi:hypothetical protein VQ7734_04415 [Vibrio quintilis]|uniref:Uncharacterized protein n=1 Tax=Vibrio quintilis TaxID=1117707 RepID=A0A1M7Z199_9VIBR|nr:hypothetical protein VQ7734_04415 [Vibrio quintilis]